MDVDWDDVLPSNNNDENDGDDDDTVGTDAQTALAVVVPLKPFQTCLPAVRQSRWTSLVPAPKNRTM